MNAPTSTLHSKLALISSEEKVKSPAGSLVEPAGPVLIVVSGTTVSTVNERLAGVSSMFPATSAARTSIV